MWKNESSGSRLLRITWRDHEIAKTNAEQGDEMGRKRKSQFSSKYKIENFTEEVEILKLKKLETIKEDEELNIVDERFANTVPVSPEEETAPSTLLPSREEYETQLLLNKVFIATNMLTFYVWKSGEHRCMDRLWAIILIYFCSI